MNGFFSGLLLGLSIALALAAFLLWALGRRSPAVRQTPTQEEDPLHALEHLSVNEVMVPRGQIEGLDLDGTPASMLEQLGRTPHSRLPLYRGDINQVQGVIHVRQIARLLGEGTFDAATLLAASREPYFVPQSTPLAKQLRHFQKQQRRLGLVVDEYGELVGLVSLEDILQQLIGTFASLETPFPQGIQALGDGSYRINGNVLIRELNQRLSWQLPSEGPKTLNGLITEALESLPESGVCLKIGPYRLEVLEIDHNRVEQVKLWNAGFTPERWPR
ncbi:transporter associated domain-containing protein [Pseudomonas sp. RIT-PI-AD]|uniref:transporter associated domain-containing protein n=1 Tax=Pseudomonas sp. RIT-PI-AD TaxID=3035294 RepID=UPI0021D92279|nr:transporter associated domain-containing protein [Pseudomonas sp. RIT-PI-AD]